MFRSRIRSINFTQYEHGRLAGTIASVWGNKSFDQPALDFDAFVAGVTLHDWGYAMMDSLPIGEAPEEEWLQVIVDPWPFSVPVISGVAYAFEREGYPAMLNPLVIPYRIQSS